MGYSSDRKSSTGFYIMISKGRSCERPFATFDGKVFYCLPDKPILGRAVFTSIGQVKTEGTRKYIDLYLSASGIETLKKVVATLPNSTVVLIVEDKVVGVLDNKEIIGKFIRIDADIHSPDIDWVHDQLTRLLRS